MPTIRNILVNANSVRTVLQNHEAVSEKSVKAASDDPVEQAMLVAGLNNALVEIMDDEASPDVLSSPPSQVASLLQTFLAEKAIEEDKPAARDLPSGGIEAKFDSKDWLGWATSFFSWAGKLHPAEWVAPQNPETMGENSRIALLADWGTGLYGAPPSGKCIQADGKFTHVIHLGDVYYSGTEKEIQREFMPYWPSVRGAVNRACNSNHEMYSGGHGYFELTLPTFAQTSSCFAIENEHWLVVGLDTAYVEHSLTKEQLGWLALLLQDPIRARKKLVLLSHHQPYSLLDSHGPKLVGFLRLFLNGGRIYAWYWGHEHRCVIYDRHPDWKLAGRCIGHGGYPYFRDTAVLQRKNGQKQSGANGSTWYRLGGLKVDADASRVPGGLIVPSAIVLDGPNPYLGDDADQYGPHGYVTLEFEGDKLYETFYTPQPPDPTGVPIMTRREV